jgi:hypothetical protein
VNERRNREIVDQLIEYWRGNPPADGAAHYRWGAVEERLIRLLPAAEARALQSAPERHRQELERILDRLGEEDFE